jgi:hypothetical protein
MSRTQHAYPDLLVTIPGIKGRNAEISIADIGVDMDRFPSRDHLA